MSFIVLGKDCFYNWTENNRAREDQRLIRTHNWTAFYVMAIRKEETINHTARKDRRFGKPTSGICTLFSFIVSIGIFYGAHVYIGFLKKYWPFF